MRINKLHIAFVFLFISLTGLSQGKIKVITAVSENNNAIIVKWYGKHVFTKNAVDVFRAEGNSENWVKLNTATIKKKIELPQELIDKDEAFTVIKNAVSNANPEDLNGFLVLIVMIKSVEYPGFADYLGIQFIDKTAVKGKSYQYKIVTDNNKTLGISGHIVFNDFAPLNAPDSAKITIKDYVPLLWWQPNENKFFGYYIYRSGNKDDVIKRLSQQPIIVTKDKEGNFPKYLFVDDTMKIGDTYHYQITGIDYFGRESKMSKELIAVIKDVTPPPPPTSVKATIRGKKIQLFWETINTPDLAGYNIYRSIKKDTEYQKINTLLVDKKYQIYNDTASHVGVLYYKVASVDTSGNEAFSYVEPAEIKDVFPPLTPTQVTCNGDTGKIVIHWKPNTESDLQGYLIYRTINKNDGSRFSLLNTKPVNTNEYIDRLPKNAKNKFFYKIVAIDTSSNRSDYSDFAVAGMPDITPPKKPVIKSVTIVENHLQIEWFQNFESDLAGYNIYRKAKNDTSQQNKKLNLNIIGKDVTVFTDVFAKSGIEYTYSITVIDTSGNVSVPSDGFSAVLPDMTSNNLSFSNFRVVQNKGKKQVKLNWKIKRNETVKAYMVYRKEQNDTRLKPLTGLINTEEYVDKNVANNKSYVYQVRAFTKRDKLIKSKEKAINIKTK